MTIIQKPSKMDKELYESILHLLPQLTEKHALPSYEMVTNLLSSNNSILYVARFPNISSPIIGMITLAVFQVPSGIRAHIEDLVVDHEFRRKGIAHALMDKALQSAKNLGANEVVLTSNSHRISALRLYESLGFKKWDTNIFFYHFDR